MDNPEDQLRVLLESRSTDTTPFAELDSLYLQVLLKAFPANTPARVLHLFQDVIGAIATSKIPLPAEGLGLLLGLGEASSEYGSQQVLRIVRKLQSLLVVPLLTTEAIQIIHPSMFDFLTNQQRCTDLRFFINRDEHNQSVAHRCLDIMNKYLTFNICKLDHTLLNSEVADLSSRLVEHLPQALQYACRFWAGYLPYCTGADADAVELFYTKRFLNWLEVLSTLGALNSAFRSLEIADNWMQVCFISRC
jgi:hypothetical protein